MSEKADDVCEECFVKKFGYYECSDTSFLECTQCRTRVGMAVQRAFERLARILLQVMRDLEARKDEEV
jgi:hypothetical protein